MSKLLRLCGVAAAFGTVLASAPRLEAASIETVLGCSGNPCVVRSNPGGDVAQFRAAAHEIKRTGTRVIIDGPCYSACAILADIARRNVCVTKNAKFGFHQGYIVAQAQNSGKYYLLGRFKPPHSRDVNSWVSKNGGYPKKGYRMMSSKSAGRIWKRC
jgi:hypothetical protein